METALPAKFASTIEEALGVSPSRPASLADLEERPQRFVVMDAEVETLKQYVAAHTQD